MNDRGPLAAGGMKDPRPAETQRQVVNASDRADRRVNAEMRLACLEQAMKLNPPNHKAALTAAKAFFEFVSEGKSDATT